MASKKKREHRPMYGPKEFPKKCNVCGSEKSKATGGNYTIGAFYCRRRICSSCARRFTTKEPVAVE